MYEPSQLTVSGKSQSCRLSSKSKWLGQSWRVMSAPIHCQYFLQSPSYGFNTVSLGRTPQQIGWGVVHGGVVNPTRSYLLILQTCCGQNKSYCSLTLQELRISLAQNGTTIQAGKTSRRSYLGSTRYIWNNRWDAGSNRSRRWCRWILCLKSTLILTWFDTNRPFYLCIQTRRENRKTGCHCWTIIHSHMPSRSCYPRCIRNRGNSWSRGERQISRWEEDLRIKDLLLKCLKKDLFVLGKKSKNTNPRQLRSPVLLQTTISLKLKTNYF